MKWGIVTNGNRGGGMEAAGGRPTGSRGALAIGLALAVAGCAAPRACYCRNGGPASPQAASTYTLACPDVLEIAAGPEPILTVRLVVDPDGTISLGTDARLRVVGLTAEQVGRQLAAVLGVSASHIQVHIADYASRQVFLCGPVAGKERAIPYEGPETVVELLRRVGGLSHNAEPREVHVVRANVAAGRRPQVFDVDLKAILARGDDKTNIRLEAYDQVYVGETARSNWAKYLPPWMHPGKQPTPGNLSQ
ncbi:MAG TPA: polysaccharide biosynthesis/export family protein [Gemmataceae bacterium]|jgi:protein involved in polysaccharide export with SLBB domain|nr:polysaccharide biosynthesis/export family protein [Gemmataceae bacterium]